MSTIRYLPTDGCKCVQMSQWQLCLSVWVGSSRLFPCRIKFVYLEVECADGHVAESRERFSLKGEIRVCMGMHESHLFLC